MSSWRESLKLEASGHSSKDQFSVGLTGVRALAAMMVLAHHLFAHAVPRLLTINIGDWQIIYHWLFTVSWMGANVFFVLSGFLLAIPFVRAIEGTGTQVRIAPYLARRIRRVVPAYWVQIVILVAILYFTNSMPSWNVIGLHFVFLQNFNQTYSYALNGVYWTLPTEFGYYLLLPLFAAFAAVFSGHRRAAWRVLTVLLIAFAIAWRMYVYGLVEEETVGVKVFRIMQLPGLIDHFAIGMLLAWVYVRHAATISGRVADCIMLAGLIGMVSMMWMVDQQYLRYWNGSYMLFVGYTVTAFFIGMLVLGVAMAGPRSLANALFANSAMLYLGIVSYSLYLWHPPILRWTMAWLDHLSYTGDRLWWLIAISIPLSLLAATISYYWIERPFMARRGK